MKKKSVMYPNVSKWIPGFIHSRMKRIRQDETSRILISGASSAFVIKVIGAGLNFATQVFLARFLGLEGYGFFAYATSWMILLSIPAQLGLRESLIRFVPEYEVSHQPGYIKGILSFAVSASFLAAVIIAGLFALVLLSKPAFWPRDQILVLWVMLGVLPVFTLNRIRESGLRAFRRVGLAFVPEHILRPIVLCSLCALIFFYTDKLMAWQAWLCNLAAFGFTFIIGSWWLWKNLPGKVISAKALRKPKHWLAVSLPMFMMSGMNVVMTQSGVILLGFFASPADVGVYAVCARIVVLINFALTSINAIAGPMIARLYHAGKKQELQNMLTLAARGIFAITFGATILLGLFGRQVLLFFGSSFVEGYVPLLILMSGQIINALAGSVVLILNMSGHQNNAAKILAMSMIINLAANFALIPEHGAHGAAIAYALSLATWNLMMLGYVWKQLKLNPTIMG